MNNNQNQDPSLEETWKAAVLPRPEANQKVFERFLQTPDHNGHVLNCAVPRERSRSLTNVEMPQGWEIKKCFPASIGRGFGIDGLKNWKYNPKICYREQLPYLHKLPLEHADLARSPWFQSAMWQLRWRSRFAQDFGWRDVILGLISLIAGFVFFFAGLNLAFL
jgi:hypothetical protein